MQMKVLSFTSKSSIKQTFKGNISSFKALGNLMLTDSEAVLILLSSLPQVKAEGIYPIVGLVYKEKSYSWIGGWEFLIIKI